VEAILITVEAILITVKAILYAAIIDIVVAFIVL